jgi:hypothetical protein
VARRPDAARDLDDACLLGLYIDAACTATTFREITFPIRAQAAHVTDGRIGRGIPVQEIQVPVSQLGQVRHRGRALRLERLLFLEDDVADLQVQAGDVPESLSRFVEPW